MANVIDDVKELRAEFGRLMRNAQYAATREEWLAAVRELALKASGGDEPTPEQWVEAARAAKVPCWSCSGKGIYYGKGYVENGVFKGFTGPCYRCGGRCKQGQDDFTRNWGYDSFHRRVI